MTVLTLQVVVQYFEPTQTSCMVIPWLREVGFSVIYGALVLKVYRYVHVLLTVLELPGGQGSSAP